MVLDDHFASDAINSGVAARAGFAESFGGLADGELDELRTDFVRKAVLAGTDRVCRPLLAAGTDDGRPRRADAWATCRRRPTSTGCAPGVPSSGCRPSDDSALLVDATTGEAVGVAGAAAAPAQARLTRVNIEANGSVCRGMLPHRYATRGEGQLEEIA